MEPIGRSGAKAHINDLVPATDTDHLLPENERSHAVQDREAIEALGREMDRRMTRKALYPVFYDEVREKLAAGVSPEDIRAEMRNLADTDDIHFVSVLHDAYEDALAGRPPQDIGNSS